MTNEVTAKRTGSTGTNADLAGFATPVEAAKFLHLSRAMVHKLIAEGKMPACRYGRAVRIPWSWLCAQTQDASAGNA
jgi:excisionase family DNA binding protein